MKKIHSYLFALSLLFIHFSCQTEQETDEIVIKEEIIEEEINPDLLSIQIPDSYVRPIAEKLHVILTDVEGNIMEYKTHGSGQTEILEFNSVEDLASDTEFTISFVQSYDTGTNYYLAGIFVYANLTKDMLGNLVRFSPRTLSLETQSIELDVPFYEEGFTVRSEASWNGMQYFSSSEKFQGHISTNYTNDLGVDGNLIQYYNLDIAESYAYAFVDDMSSKTELSATEFITDGVKHTEIAIEGSLNRPFIEIFGYDSKDHYFANSYHELFRSYLGPNFDTWQYSYPEIFDYNRYAIQIANYMIEGNGFPPNQVTIPNVEINYGLTENTIIYEGLQAYEVGRIRLKNIEGAASYITAEFTFNGNSDTIVMPKLPEDVFPSKVIETFQGSQMEIIQGAAVNYTNFESYDDYISNVMVKTVPYYTVSDRKSIFKSSVSSFYLPVDEFPF